MTILVLFNNIDFKREDDSNGLARDARQPDQPRSFTVSIATLVDVLAT
jgi:hypothetical protein